MFLLNLSLKVFTTVRTDLHSMGLGELTQLQDYLEKQYNYCQSSFHSLRQKYYLSLSKLETYIMIIVSSLIDFISIYLCHI